MSAEDFIDQIRRVQHKLKRGDRAFRDALPEASEASARILHDEMRQRVPVDTGETKRSIGMRPGSAGRDHAQHIVYTTSPIWHFIEYGTSKWSGHPFVRPALEMTTQQRKDAAIDAIMTKVRIATS